ncbi:hypothetical protein [Absidia glauca]|uniref:Uncharacterized protein n=1 Tax=Absidia glauca TaxID=4829 RepID=A0A163IVV4_ABSGL|nr:hypothetical protein [Absidia glauca]
MTKDIGSLALGKMDLDLEWRFRRFEFKDYENHGETLGSFFRFPHHCLDEEHYPFAHSATDTFVTPTSSHLLHRFGYYTRLVLSLLVSPLNLTQTCSLTTDVASF